MKILYRDVVYDANVDETVNQFLSRNDLEMKGALVASLNKVLVDLDDQLIPDAELNVYTWDSKYGKLAFWHSSAHLLAEAVLEEFPNAKLGIGPPIDGGFYYDINLNSKDPFNEDLQKKIEKRVVELAKRGVSFQKKFISKLEAINQFNALEQPYKIDLIEGLEDGEISTYTQGNFTDLCKGPHIPNSRSIQAIKILKVAGAYWKGDENNDQLTRIYAISFPNRKDLRVHLKMLEEASKRDHKKLGKKFELFTSSPLVGRGFPLLLPNGATLRRILERFVVDEEVKRGYQHVYTPSLAKKKMYEISGHWDLYKDSMYPPMLVNGEEMVLRPMTCPHHFMIYADKSRSYRELPLRIAELAQQYRKEQSGEVSGLVRVMTFTLADSHIFCREDQVAEEFKGAVELIDYAMKSLGIDSKVSYRASFRDDSKEKYVDNDVMWERTQNQLVTILDEIGLEYHVEKGHAAFYGPKLDVQMENVYGKDDTVFTVQIDFALPERFDLTYINENGDKSRPLVVHRSSIGSLERTLAFLIEYYASAFPTWLSPVQVKVLTISEQYDNYGLSITEKMKASGIRVETDFRNETLGRKKRDGRLSKIPYLIIIGNEEEKEETVSVWNRDTQKQITLKVDEFISRVIDEVNTHSTVLNI